MKNQSEMSPTQDVVSACTRLKTHNIVFSVPGYHATSFEVGRVELLDKAEDQKQSGVGLVCHSSCKKMTQPPF